MKNITTKLRSKCFFIIIYKIEENNKNFISQDQQEGRHCHCQSEHGREKLAERKYEAWLARSIKEDPKHKHLYRYVRSKIKETVGPLTDNDTSVLVWDEGRMVEIFNQEFMKVFMREKNNDENFPGHLYRGEILTPADVSLDKVTRKLEPLNPEKSPGDNTKHPYY